MVMQDFWRIVENVVENSDYVIEVVDARMPDITRNKKAENIVRKKGRKLIIVATKSDYVSRDFIENYKNKVGDVPFFYVSVRDRKGITLLRKNIYRIMGKRNIPWMTNIGFIGYPNTGKSSLINALSGRKASVVGSRPGMTKGYQWVRLTDKIRLVDTPGVIPLYDKDETKQIMMNSLDPANANRIDKAAQEIVELFLKQNKKAFENAYGIKTDEKSFGQIVEDIGNAKKMIKKGGEVDERRVHLKIIDDWQKGRILLNK